MATRMQQRRGTADEWLLADPVLAAGEIGFETNTGSFKIGDGVNNWSLLDYFETSASFGGTLEDYIELAEKGAPLGVAELDENGFVPASQLNIDVTGDINAAISALVDGAPGVLDTLNELAAALGDDADFFNTINGNITSGDSATLASAQSYADQAELDAVATANAYTDAEIAAIPAPDFTGYALETYVDTAEADAVTTANAYTDTRETAITTAYEAYADQAELDAKAYTDTRETAISTAYQTYADTAESDAVATANSYTDGRETAITTAYQSYADQAEADAVSTAASDATTKANAALASAQSYADTAEADAISAAAVDATTKAGTAETNAKAYTDDLIGDGTVDGTTGNTVTARIASAVAGLVDTAPEALNTLNELAAALGDDPNFATTVATQIGGKANTVHTHTLTDVTDVTATATELNYVSGVTSAIQTQLDAKPDNISELGDVTITSAAAGEVLSYNGTAWINTATIDGGNA